MSLSQQKFGGDWTGIKLGVFENYMDSYLTALKKQKFDKIYIDAFAGNGIYKANERLWEGSAMKALRKDSFIEYHFIELNRKKANELQQRIEQHFPEKIHMVTIHKEDANIAIINILENMKNRNKRALMLLDPFALSLKWETFKSIKEYRYFDIWYLIPIMAYNRMLAKNLEKIEQSWKDKFIETLGFNDWEEVEKQFYKISPQGNFFAPDVKIKEAKFEKIEQMVYNRLSAIFDKGVLRNMVQLKNTKSTHMFSFCFIATNLSPKALGLSMRMAKDIVKKWS